MYFFCIIILLFFNRRLNLANISRSLPRAQRCSGCFTLLSWYPHGYNSRQTGSRSHRIELLSEVTVKMKWGHRQALSKCTMNLIHCCLHSNLGGGCRMRTCLCAPWLHTCPLRLAHPQPLGSTALATYCVFLLWRVETCSLVCQFARAGPPWVTLEQRFQGSRLGWFLLPKWWCELSPLLSNRQWLCWMTWTQLACGWQRVDDLPPFR